MVTGRRALPSPAGKGSLGTYHLGIVPRRVDICANLNDVMQECRWAERQFPLGRNVFSTSCFLSVLQCSGVKPPRFRSRWKLTKGLPQALSTQAAWCKQTNRLENTSHCPESILSLSDFPMATEAKWENIFPPQLPVVTGVSFSSGPCEAARADRATAA